MGIGAATYESVFPGGVVSNVFLSFLPGGAYSSWPPSSGAASMQVYDGRTTPPTAIGSPIPSATMTTIGSAPSELSLFCYNSNATLSSITLYLTSRTLFESSAPIARSVPLTPSDWAGAEGGPSQPYAITYLGTDSILERDE